MRHFSIQELLVLEEIRFPNIKYDFTVVLRRRFENHLTGTGMFLSVIVLHYVTHWLFGLQIKRDPKQRRKHLSYFCSFIFISDIIK